MDELRAEFDRRAAELGQQARKLETDFELMQYQWQQDLKALQRQGLLPKGTKLRSSRTPTAALSRRVNSLLDVVMGRARGIKVTKRQAKQFRDQGFSVVNDRVVLSPQYRVERGEVVQQRNIGGAIVSGGRRVRSVRLRARLEEQVAVIFAGMTPGEFVGIDLVHGNTRLFGAGDETLFLDYLMGKGSFVPAKASRISLLYYAIEEAEEHIEEVADRREQSRLRAQDEARIRRSLRRKRGRRGSKNRRLKQRGR